MGLKSIPIASIGIGPGSQPLEEDGARLEYIDLPEDMRVYQKPLLPEPEEVRHLADTMEVMEWVQQALQRYRPGEDPLLVDISTLDAQNRELVNQILGEGEVAIRYAGAFQAKMQESVLAGVWRTFYVNEQGAPIRDLLEVGDVPVLARLLAKSASPAVQNLSNAQPRSEVMNAMPILTEIEDRISNLLPGAQAHVINLTLLPLSKEDVSFLDRTLGLGPVSILSRGYGDCRITSTAVPNVWWVRYYNSTGTLILNTLEIVDIPVAACAAEEDLQDSALRLKEMLEPYQDVLYPWTNPKS
ncbi:MAG: hydrogenase expression/formation C-terminal domain-containing protein [Pseudomonadota bacterium]